jgi:hypothetical protein
MTKTTKPAPAHEPTAQQIERAGEVKRKLYGKLWVHLEARRRVEELYEDAKRRKGKRR